jgi:hypothetical protein
VGKLKYSAMLDGGSGSVGNLVVAEVRGGPIVKRKPRYRRPTSPAQAAAAERMTLASAAWSATTQQQLQAWRDYAKTIWKSNALTGKRYKSTAQNEFIALATKFLQATPGGTVPAWPPSSAYIGDAVSVGVSEFSGASAQTAPHPLTPSLPEGRGGTGASAHTAPHPLAPSPPEGRGGTGRRFAIVGAGEGGIRWTASAPNDPDTVTELLIQELKSPRRSPQKIYTSAAFHQFVDGSLSFDLSLEPGTYATAYRFVRLSTGQMTEVIPIEVLTIGDEALLAA